MDLHPRMVERLGLRRSPRPVPVGSDAGFDLAYVRTEIDGHGDGPPVLVIPGGPGLASVVPYAPTREQGQRRGLDVVMVEHRGVGFSRRDATGADLPPEALTLELVVADLAAVLDTEGIERVVVYGSSYGSYVAQLFGLRHPDRVAGMVLDAPMVRAGEHGPRRDHLRSLLWHGDTPETARAAAMLRACIEDGRIDADTATEVVQQCYEFAGVCTLERLLEMRAAGRAERLWDHLADLARQETTRTVPNVMEFDLVDRIAFRELRYAPEPDGQPLDVDLPFAAHADRAEPFEAEPADLVAALPGFAWPIAVVRGERDLRSPSAVVDLITAAAPDTVRVTLPGSGHSILDQHPLAALHIAHAVQVGGHARLPALAERLAALPRPAGARAHGMILAATVALHRVLPRTRSAPP